MRLLTDGELGWVAGLLEGEGSFDSGGRPGGLRIQVAMTDLDVLERLAQVVGTGTVNGPYKYQAKQKPYWRWTVRGTWAMILAARIRPNMGARRRQRITALLEEMK